MDDYPRRIYLAASWRGVAETVTGRVARSLAGRGFTLLGDHPIHRSQETGRDLHWQQRVDDIMMDCCGLVAVLPPDDAPQTTSPYFLPEIMIAARQQLPILLIHAPGVSVSVIESAGERMLWLPAADRSLPTAGTAPAFKYPSIVPGTNEPLARDETYSDEDLHKIRKVDLSDSPMVKGPTRYQDAADDHAVESAIDVFLVALRDRPTKYVFHIVPFARMPLHERVAATVFEETGLPCVIAPDNWRSPEPARQHWRQLLGGAAMVVADLSESNRNCLFEAGVADGMNRPLQLVRGGAARSKPNLPFGLDDHLQASYESEQELVEVVRRFCLPFKRTVFNLSKLAEDGEPAPGVPRWYSRSKRSGLGARGLRLQAILSVAVAVLLGATAVRLVLPQYFAVFAALIAAPVVVLTLVARLLDAAKSDLNDCFVSRARQIRNVSVVLAVAAAVAIVAGWGLRSRDTNTSGTAQQGNAVDRPAAGN